MVMSATAEATRHAVVALYTDLLETWNQRDADAFAALFADSGNCVGFDGSQLNGRPHIAAELSSIFATYPTAAFVAKVREVRDIDAQTVLLRAIVGMVPPGQKDLSPAVNAVQSLIVVKERDRWRIALLQNTPAAYHGRPHLVEQHTQELTEVVRAGRVVQAS
jgi:uncharacterized protein (TIGR02246 family)